MIGFILLDSLQNRKNIFQYITRELLLWFVFGVTSFIFGLMIAVDYTNLINALSTFLQFLILIWGIVYIANQDGNINFFVDVFTGYSIISALTTLFWGIDYGQGRISMGLSNNPNTLGITMVIGIICILYRLNLKKTGYSILAFFSIMLLIYVSLLTGSRKSVLSIVLLLIYWFFIVAAQDFKIVRGSRRLTSIFLVVIVAGIGYAYISPFLEESVILHRFSMLLERGAATREGMYREAFEMFRRSPLIGVGFNNYRSLSLYGTYSHSTLAEALACTGLIGSILYFSSYLMLTLRYIRMAIKKTADIIFLKQSRMLLGLMLVLLFLSFSVIHFYGMSSTIAFGLLIAFYNSHKHKMFSKAVSSSENN